MKKKYLAEKRMYERIFFSLLRKKNQILDGMPKLGYTSSDGDIYIGFDHPLIKKAASNKRPLCRMGVFAHETLHQFFTDFSFANRKKEELRPSEMRIFFTFANLIEDSAIENFAPTVMGGNMISSLRFMIRHTYKEDTGLGSDKTPMAELIHALIMFGDMGLVKGAFQYPEAFAAFQEIAPEFNQMIDEPVSQKRQEAALRWMEQTRPIWEKEAPEDDGKSFGEGEHPFDALPQKSSRGTALESMSPKMDGNALIDEIEDNPTSGGALEGARERRERFLKDVSKCSDEGAGSPGDDPDSDEASDEDKKDTFAETMKELSEKSESEADEVLAEEGKKDDALAKELADDIKKVTGELAKEEQERRESKKKAISDLEAIQVPDYEEVNCDNVIAKSNPLEYEMLLGDLKGQISLLTGTLKRLFAQDLDTNVRSTSGRLNVRRQSAKNTIKFFDKKKEKREVSDLAVFLLVDESGSMYDKYRHARDAAIVLAETMYNLHVPCYVMGFTADVHESGTASHRHYTTWKTTREQLAGLANISHRCNNDDPYSIATATALLKARPESHKILFVLSDGEPAANRLTYNRMQETALVINKAKKVASVVGIGIRTCREDTEYLYGADSCIVINNTRELPNLLIRQLKRVLKTF